MNFDKSVISELNSFIDKYISDVIKEYGNRIACRDKISHIKSAISISQQMYDDDMIVLATKYHDIGRFPQYGLLGNFDDGVVTHNVLGENYIQKLIKNKEIPASKELDALRLVVQFHGKENLIPFSHTITPEAVELVRKVTMIDDIENSCIGILGYLQRERDEDAKGYKKSNPELDMKEISPEVLLKFLNGESFDKIVYCRTYADYAIFVASLLVKCLRSEGYQFCKAILAKPCFNYSDAINGYYEVLKDMIDNKYLDACMDVIMKYYNNYIPYENSIEIINPSLRV